MCSCKRDNTILDLSNSQLPMQESAGIFAASSFRRTGTARTIHKAAKYTSEPKKVQGSSCRISSQGFFLKWTSATIGSVAMT